VLNSGVVSVGGKTFNVFQGQELVQEDSASTPRRIDAVFTDSEVPAGNHDYVATQFDTSPRASQAGWPVSGWSPYEIFLVQAGNPGSLNSLDYLSVFDSNFAISKSFAITFDMQDNRQRPFAFATVYGQIDTLSFSTSSTGDPGPSPVPLPASAWLLLSSISGLLGLKLRRKQ
jgi:hypothetical protein